MAEIIQHAVLRCFGLAPRDGALIPAERDVVVGREGICDPSLRFVTGGSA